MRLTQPSNRMALVGKSMSMVIFSVHLGIVLFSMAGPLLLLVSTFQVEGSFSLDPWRNVLGDLGRWKALLVNTGIAFSSAALICIPMGAVVAFLLFRTDIGARRMGLPLVSFAAALPLYVVNASLLAVLGLKTLQGSALAVGGIHALAQLPVVVFLMGISYQLVSKDLEELASIDGAGPIKIFLRVILPGAMGGVILSFVWILWWLTMDYSVSDVLLVRTFPEELYTQFALNGRPAEPTLVSLPQMLVFAAVLWSSKGAFLKTEIKAEPLHRPSLFRLGAWNFPGALALMALLLCMALLPVVLLLSQMGPIGTLPHFARVFAPEIWTSLWTSFAAGLLCAGLAPGLAWYLVRRPRWRLFLAAYVILMLSFPAPLLGMGLINLFNHEGLLGLVYDSPIMLLLAYTIRFLPLGVLLLTSTLRSLPAEIEMMARADGCGDLDVLRHIVFPLCARPMLTALFLTVILSLGELPCSLLVTPPGYATVASRFFSMIHYGLYRDAAALCLLSILCLHHYGMKPFLHLSVGEPDRFDQVIDRRARPEAGHVGADFPSRAADGVAAHAGEFLASIHFLPANRVALGQDIRGHLLQFGFGERHLAFVNAAGARQGQDKIRLAATAFARGAEAGLGHGLGQTRFRQSPGQNGTGSSDAQQGTPERQDLRFGGGFA